MVAEAAQLALASQTAGIGRWRSFAAMLAICGTTLLSACTTSQPASESVSFEPLALTQWALNAIKAGVTKQDTVRIADPRQFTLSFGADGAASFKLDCNRGMSNYTSNATDANTGELAFGPVASTRALCPPPNLDERIARDMGHVRAYQLKDGKLLMLLAADGGSYEWQRLTD